MLEVADGCDWAWPTGGWGWPWPVGYWPCCCPCGLGITVAGSRAVAIGTPNSGSDGGGWVDGAAVPPSLCWCLPLKIQLIVAPRMKAQRTLHHFSRTILTRQKGGREYSRHNSIDGFPCSKNSCFVPGIFVSLPTGFQRGTPLQEVACQIVFTAGTQEIIISKVIRYRPRISACVAEIITIKTRCRHSRCPDYEHEGIKTKLNPD